MLLRCVIDGLLLPAVMQATGELAVHDGEEVFLLDAMEAVYYEVAAASREELLRLEQAHFRLLRAAADCRLVKSDPSPPTHQAPIDRDIFRSN